MGEDDDAMVMLVLADRMDATQSISNAFYMPEQAERIE